MNRKSSIYRINSPSIKQRNRILQQATRYASIVDSAMITLVKALGSSLKEGEYTLTIPDAAAHAAKPWEKLHFSEGEQGQLVVSVSIDPDMAKQIEAFKLELNAEHTASSDGSLL